MYMQQTTLLVRVTKQSSGSLCKDDFIYFILFFNV